MQAHSAFAMAARLLVSTNFAAISNAVPAPDCFEKEAQCQWGQPTEPLSDQLPNWPIASGLSISLGYVVGGIIPLFPYFFTSTVGRGLHWSIALCLIALMVFGSGKSWVLHGEEKSVKRSLWEGLQMLILGSLAAGAAVLCVNLVGAGSEPSH